MADREFVHDVDKCTSEKWFQKIKPFQQMWAFFGLFPCVHACKVVCLSTSRVVGHDDEKTNDSSRVISVCVEPGDRKSVV